MCCYCYAGGFVSARGRCVIISLAIKTENLSKIYTHDTQGEPVGLVDLSLEVEEGQIFGLLGPNGSGKTTTLKLFLGLIFPTSGHGEIFGHRLGSTAYKERVGFLPEGPYFYEHLNAVELLEFYGSLFGMGGKSLEKRIQYLLELVGMWDRRLRRIRDYSRGMRQRVGVAQAMINDPDLLFLDELTSGLDPLGAMDMHRLVQNLRDEGKTVFLCSHLLKDMEPICDQVIILNQGRACEFGRVDDLLKVEGEYRMVVSSYTDELARELAEGALRTEERSEGFVAYYADQTTALDAASQAAAAGAHLEDLSVHQRSLEEVFIDAVGGRE
ncbi:MAG: ABC transporter ATP-binding protein [Armatimonadota bacterium]